MGNFVTQGAVLQCSFGLSPCTLVITVPSRPKCTFKTKVHESVDGCDDGFYGN